MTARVVDVGDRIDSSKVGPLHIIVFALCGLCLIMDGFDVQAMGYVAPALVRDWHIPSSAMGPVFSSALIGVLLGSLFLGALADRVGRRPVLIFGTLYFSLLTLLTATAGSIGQLLTIRFLGGLGLGGMMPGAMSLAGEYSPKRIRVLTMMAVSCGFTAGAALGGLISAWLIPAYGWRSVFVFGGAVPLVVGVLMMFFLPESLPFLAVRRKDPARIAELLSRMEPSDPVDVDSAFVTAEKERKGAPVARLFQEGRSGITILLWVVNFMNLLNLYFLASWVPTVTRDAGYSTSIAALVGAAVQIGGTIGSLGNGKLIERLGFVRTLSAGFAIGAVAIALTGQVFRSLPLLFATVFVAGWAVPGGQPGVNAFAAVYYPIELRSTGIGWGLGIGRIGAILGPFIGAQLIAMRWSSQDVFLASAIPAAVSALAMLGLRRASY
ncbi:MAG TPA: MFS transporter [Bryobacteraceae bacterium]|nr:MFS transporter [Bryobacteraceae bacterium]